MATSKAITCLYTLLSSILLLVQTPTFSQSTYSFLNAPAHARLAALGGVNVSLTDRDVNLFSSNPSLGGDTLNGFASASYQFYLADIGQANFSYQHHFKKIGALAFGVQHMSYGTIKSYDASGVELGDFSSGETALMAGKYFQSAAFRFGATLKTIFSNLAGYHASAIAVDLGGVFIHPEDNFTIGLAIKNIGFTLSDYSETSSSALPFDVQLGTTFKPDHMPFRFSLTAFDLTDFESFEDVNSDVSAVDRVMRHLNLGTELLLGKNVNVLMSYNFRNRQELKLEEIGGGAGFSVGLSVQVRTIELVISRSSYGPKQASVGFTLSTNVNKMIRKRETI